MESVLRIIAIIAAVALLLFFILVLAIKLYAIYQDNILFRSIRDGKEQLQNKKKNKHRRNRKENYGETHYSVIPIKTPEDEWAERYMANLAQHKRESFFSKLESIISSKNLDAVEIYKKADIDRRLFSKLKKDDYHPRKKTVLSLAIAMELNLQETEELLLFSGYALAPNRDFDLIIKDCIENKNYKLLEINKILFRCTKETL